MDFAAGQRWTYRAPPGFEASRIVIGAVVSFGAHDLVVCAAVSGVPRRHPDGRVETVNIAFLPFSQAAFEATILIADGSDVPPPAFASEMEHWASDPRGLSTFTVAFDGYLDKLIARQMAEIVGPAHRNV
ncbi:MAG: hypothetical protein ABL901_15060 [Hyphomicrobiaceae bacterium]